VSNSNGKGWGYGWHAGLLYQFSQATRAGITYHSQVSSNLKGTSKLVGPIVPTTGYISNDNFGTNIILPPTTEVSIYHQYNNRWAFQGSADYTQWDNVHGIQSFKNVAVTPPANTANATASQHFRNTWFLAAGTSYQYNPAWLLRAGINYNNTPVRNSERGLELPDSNRVGVAVGAHYQYSTVVGFDLGYQHLFMQSASINQTRTVGLQSSHAVGKVTSHADLYGLQLTLG
jgi:long-chain fatty acid transport protein